MLLERRAGQNAPQGGSSTPSPVRCFSRWRFRALCTGIYCAAIAESAELFPSGAIVTMKVLDLHCRSEHVSLKAGLRPRRLPIPAWQRAGSVPCVGMTRYKTPQRSAPELARFGVSQCAGAHRRTFATASATLRRFPGCGVAAADAASRCSVEDVGERFTEEARKMHWGEADQRPIRGQANIDQTLQLLEEGIPVLPLPPALKEPLQ